MMIDAGFGERLTGALYQVSTQALQLVAMNHAIIGLSLVLAVLSLVAAAVGWLSGGTPRKTKLEILIKCSRSDRWFVATSLADQIIDPVAFFFEGHQLRAFQNPALGQSYLHRIDLAAIDDDFIVQVRAGGIAG